MALIVDRDAAHDAAQRELSKPIYPKEGPVDRFTDWLFDLIYRLMMNGSRLPGGWFTIAVVLTLVAVAVFIAVRIARRTMRSRHGDDFRVFDASERSAAEFRAAAERYAAEGNWPAAIRNRLRALARQLEENQVLNAVPGRTANELARDATRAFPDLRAELTSAAASFNDVTYGERPGSEASYRGVAGLDEQIRARRSTAAHAGPSDGGDDSWAELR
jgi:hypothetical protein